VPYIKVYRTYYSVDDGGLIANYGESEEYACDPDEFDVAEGVTPVDMALEVLNQKIYAEEASSYPDWQKNTWYSRTEPIYDYEGADTLETSAHLIDFSDVEQLEVYKRFTNR
jgi:hypothetical protein